MLKNVIETPTPTIYFIEAMGLNRVKIGFTQKPLKRFLQIRTACPVPAHVIAIIPGSRVLEADFHREFSERRLCGEWFGFSPEEIIGLSQLRDQDAGLWNEFVMNCMTAGIHGAFKYRESDRQTVVFAAFEGLLPAIMEGCCNE